MQTITQIAPHERAMLMRDGQPVDWIEPGRRTFWSWFAQLKIVRFNIDEGFAPLTPELASVLPDSAGQTLFVPAGHLAAVTQDGRPLTVLAPGRYVLWQLRHEIRATLYDMNVLISAMPPEFWPFVPAGQLQKWIVHSWQRGLLFVNGELEQVLEPGRYAVPTWRRQATLTCVDMREQELQITGQEVMTADKVSLRVNLLVKFRVVDPSLSVQAVTNLRDALYAESQLIARRWVSGLKVDDLLEQRSQGGQTMRQALHERAILWGVEPLRLDLKDVVLPGEMKTILNQVIEAEKQAAANLILRREETAATRSLANTAKVLQSNPTLLRLKELEALKEIADRIDHITVVAGGGDLMNRLRLPEA